MKPFFRALAIYATWRNYTGKLSAKRMSAGDYTALLAALCVVDLGDEPARALAAAQLVTLSSADKAKIKAGEWPTKGMRADIATKSLGLESGKCPSAGVYHVPADVYHGWPAVHSTALPRLAESFAKYKAPHKVDSPSADIGSYTHAEFLEAQGSLWEIVEAATRRAKAWRECTAKLKITDRELARAHNCIASLKANELIVAMMDRAIVEQSIIWHERVDGEAITCKARIDVYTRLGDLCDLKTTAKGVGAEAYASKMHYGLPFQMALYRRALQSLGLEVHRCLIWLAPTAEPFVPAEVHEVPKPDVDRAWRIIEERMLPRLALHRKQPDAWQGIRPGKKPSINTHWHQGEWYWRKWGVE